MECLDFGDSLDVGTAEDGPIEQSVNGRTALRDVGKGIVNADKTGNTSG